MKGRSGAQAEIDKRARKDAKDGRDKNAKLKAVIDWHSEDQDAKQRAGVEGAFDEDRQPGVRIRPRRYRRRGPYFDTAALSVSGIGWPSGATPGRRTGRLW